MGSYLIPKRVLYDLFFFFFFTEKITVMHKKKSGVQFLTLKDIRWTEENGFDLQATVELHRQVLVNGYWFSYKFKNFWK